MPRVGDYYGHKYGPTWGTHGSSTTLTRYLRMPRNGWITEVGAFASGYHGPTTGALVIYSAGYVGDNLFNSPRQRWDAYGRWRSSQIPGGLRLNDNVGLYVGIWGYPEPNGRDLWLVANTEPGRTYYNNSTYPDPQQSIQDWGYGIAKARPYVYFDYIANQRPGRPELVGTSPSGQIGDFNPTIDCTLPHDNGDGGYDESDEIQVRIYDKTAKRYLYNGWLSLTRHEINSGRFTRKIRQHTPGHDYWVDVRHTDLFGVRSYFARRQHYTTNSGPDAPVLSQPRPGEVEDTQDPSLAGTIAHPDGIAVDDIAVRLWNAAGTRIIEGGNGWHYIGGDGDFVRPLSTLGVTTPLDWGRGYQVDVYARDAAGVVGPLSELRAFRTNSAPNRPSNLTPDDTATPSGTLSASVSDPDDDSITTVEVDLYDLTNDARVAGYPKRMLRNIESGGTFNYDASADMVLGRRYQWRCLASDGVLDGAYAPFAEFIYDQVPEVSMLAPSPDGLTNLVPQPSMERIDVEAFWFPFGSTSMRFVADGDAYHRERCIEADKAANAATGVIGEGVPVTAGQSYTLYAALKVMYEDPNAQPIRLRVDVVWIDSSNAVISSSAATLFEDILRVWDYYGGAVTAPQGAVQGRVRVLAENTDSSGTFRVDAVPFYEIPETISGAAYPPVEGWHGYLDGGTESFVDEDDYRWLAKPGDSQSRGPNRVFKPVDRIMYSYTSNAAQAANRLHVELSDGVDYVPLHDSGWISSASPYVEVPVGLLRNEARHRVRVECRDVNGLVGHTEWVEFDVDYLGPTPVFVTGVNSSPDQARISLEWEPTNLPDVDFLGYEVSILEDEGKRRIITDLLTDPAATSYDYEYPISGQTYPIQVRQVMDLDGSPVPGKWAGDETSVEYYPYFFLKDLTDPSVYVKFDPAVDEAPGFEDQGEMTGVEMMFLDAPVGFDSGLSYDATTFTMRLWDVDWIEQGKEEQLRAARTICKESRRACLLSHVPAKKTFSTVTGFSYKVNAQLDYDVEVGLEETYWEEDFYRRGGSERGVPY